jgi:alpha-L-fucosidase
MAPVLAMSTPMLSSCGGTSTPPQPYGATPSPQQVEWQKMEYYMFAHFGPNTFTDMEWGLGNEDPRVFAPTDLDCRQWAQIARDAGMKGIIVTAKHHDGFCLWPSAQSKHTVRESGWRDGKGDVLRELADACREYGLRFGVYVSPWDRNHPAYGTPEYNKVFAETLREVLTNYGDVFEQWLDGANGEGPTGRTQPYDWNLFHNAIYESAPQVIVFSDIGPDARWVGNERGFAGETNWSRLNVTGFTPGLGAPHRDTLNQGNVHGERWLPAEADVSIRPGWFWSAKTNDKVKSVDDLMKIWYGSVGRNANLLLNVPPDRTGRVHPADSARLMEFRVARESAFAKDLAAGATVSASSTRGKNFAATLLTDNDYETWWAAAEKSKTADLTVDLGAPTAFNSVAVQEYIPMGQRVAGFNLSWFDEAAGEWKPLAKGTTIGYKRILNFERVTAQKLKLTIASSLAAPVLSSISIYDSPTL